MKPLARTRVYVDPHGENLARFVSVKKRLIAAGYPSASGAGYGAYGAEMVITSATKDQAKAVLASASYAADLRYSNMLSLSGPLSVRL